MQRDIRMSGLGGQGVVTAAHILGGAAVKEGRNAVVNPFFGAEKRLAPAESYVRISDEPIYDTGEILYPHVILVYHPEVILKGKSYTMPFFSGLRQNGVILVNAERPLEFGDDERRQIERLRATVHFLPATEIAKKEGGTELSTNIAMLGGLLGLTGVVSLSCLDEALTERFGGKSKFVASGTTAALDDALKRQYDKVEKLVLANRNVLMAAYELARAAASAAS